MGLKYEVLCVCLMSLAVVKEELGQLDGLLLPVWELAALGSGED